MSAALLLGILSGCSGSPEKTPEGSTMGLVLKLDGGYALQFSADTAEYEVHIPAGRPRIPKVLAQGGEMIEVIQAVIPDDGESGTATVYCAGKPVYRVRFVRDASLGFHLQYDDYYTFREDAASLESSDPSVLEIAPNGRLHARALSETPVTVRALAADGSELESLTVDKIVKAPLNIFLITGQSNAYGSYDIPDGMDAGTFTNQQRALALCPEPGTVLCTDVSNVGEIYGYMYDLSVGRSGFSPALGKTWYDLTGEKTLMLQTAVGGAPIEAWEKPTETERFAYGDIRANFYETTKNAFDTCLAEINAENSGYELNRVHAYWLQGETGMSSTFDPNLDGEGVGNWIFGNRQHIVETQEYYDIFMKNMEYFEQDFGVSFMGILLVRAVTEVISDESRDRFLYTDLCPARAAQYALHNRNGMKISIVSRVCDIARPEFWPDQSVEGWGYMGSGNLHYNQKGHNANGYSAAAETYNLMYGGDARKAVDIEVIGKNGRDRFEDGGELKLRAGQKYQTAAMVMPEYTDTPLVTYSVKDPSVCTIDEFGMITVATDAYGKSTKVTYRCEAAGLEKTVTVTVREK